MNRNWRETGGARRPLEREKVIYLADSAEPVRRYTVTWERSQPELPRWLETLSNWVEGLSTAVMAGCAVYWMWYCMWGL